MHRFLFVLLMMVAADIAAEIYRWVDAEGRPQFGDRPEAPSERLSLPEFKAGGPDKAPQAPGTGALLGPYTAFELVAPLPNQTIRQTEETMDFSLLLDPPLIEGHQLQMVLDGGDPIPVDRKAGTQFSLAGVRAGSHRVYAQVRDAQDSVVARTAEVTFHLRKPIPPGVLQ